jgi:hypothetical protein
MLQNGKIIKVLNYNGEPKHNHVWMIDVEYYTETIVVGESARLLCDNRSHLITTSVVTKIQEDENNLILTTGNSIYYIKKYS